MQVYKYKTFQEARDALLVKNPDKKYYKMLAEFYENFSKIFTRKFPHGVYKFKTIQDAQKQKEDWISGKLE
jgi:hypothetical protein